MWSYSLLQPVLYSYRISNFIINNLYSSESQVNLMNYQIYRVWKDAAASCLKVVDRDLCGGAEVNCEPQEVLCLRRYSNQTLANTSQRYYCSVHSLLRKAIISLTSNGHEFTGQLRPCCHALVLSCD